MSDRKRQEVPGILWVVATPIGNLQDLTPRARGVLEAADTILCEDTRQTQKLLHAIGSPREGRDFERLDAHASPGKLRRAVERLQEGARLALVSDAGTPGISDPGAELVRAAREAGIRIEPIAGPSALAVFLSAAGFTGTGFTFRGFFPRKAAEQKEALASAQSGVLGPWVWFESPQRIADALADIAAAAPAARVVAAKELSKIHERFFDGVSEDVAREVAAEISREGARGEWIFGVEFLRSEAQSAVDSSDWVKGLQCLLNCRITAPEAARQVSQVFGAPRNEVYRRALELSGKKSAPGG